MSMVSEICHAEDARKLERLLLKTLEEENSYTRERIQAYLLPLFQDAVNGSGGCYSSAEEARVMGQIGGER